MHHCSLFTAAECVLWLNIWSHHRLRLNMALLTRHDTKQDIVTRHNTYVTPSLTSPSYWMMSTTYDRHKPAASPGNLKEKANGPHWRKLNQKWAQRCTLRRIPSPQSTEQKRHFFDGNITKIKLSWLKHRLSKHCWMRRCQSMTSFINVCGNCVCFYIFDEERKKTMI